MRIGVLELLHVEQTQLAKLLGGHVGFGVLLKHLDLPVDELEDGRHGEVEAEGVEDADFHVQHLVFSVSFVGDVDKVSDLWRLDFLLLARDQHAGHAHQLQLASVQVGGRQLAVYDVHSEIERFRQQLEFEVHLQQPVD